MNNQPKSERKSSLDEPFHLINGFPTVATENRFSKREPSTRAYVHNGTTFSHPNNLRPRKKSKSEQLKIVYQTQSKLVELLNEVGEIDTAENMKLCGQKFSVLTCGSHIISKTAFHRCNVRYCPLCANRRASKYQNKYLPIAKAFLSGSDKRLTPCLLTFTQNKIVGERLKDSRERILKSFRKLIRHQFFVEYFDGGIFTIENTISENSNHTHIHSIVFRKKFIDHKLLKSHWKTVSPLAENLNIKLIDSLENGLRETIKYVSKPINMADFERRHLLELLEIKGKRMIDSFGAFRKFCQSYEPPETETTEKQRLNEGDCCPNCNDNNNYLFQITFTAKQLVKFYRQIENHTPL